MKDEWNGYVYPELSKDSHTGMQLRTEEAISAERGFGAAMEGWKVLDKHKTRGRRRSGKRGEMLKALKVSGINRRYLSIKLPYLQPSR